MILPDKVYNILKWLCLICIPAFTAFYCVIDQVFCIGVADKVATISTALCALIGALIGISTANYQKANEDVPDDEN